MRTKKLISFDFDDTLVKTPLPEEGKIVWKEKPEEKETKLEIDPRYKPEPKSTTYIKTNYKKL